ncbi:MAG TPA: hypothetical protein VLE43_05315 [Candidatus Saccharimonadia bacterium]|nr:hypothetical protein [Candidatus Saccharimonadia bacterium]
MNQTIRLALLGVAAWCLCTGPVTAQDAFIPPQPHAKDRYESGWLKNPFTLKTAPVVEEKKSFAKDLVLHNVFRVMNEVTVVLANTKTKELFRLKSTEPAANGMKIRSVMIQDLKKDSYVEVELNGESAVLRHDDTFRKQMMAGNNARTDRKSGEDKGKPKDPTEQPPTPPTAPHQGPTAGKADPRGNAAAASRPPLPQHPDALAQSSTSEPMNIRPGGSRTLPLPPRGAPNKGSRRFFTAPPPAPPPASETP